MRSIALLFCLVFVLSVGTLWFGSRAAPLAPQQEKGGSSSVMFIENVGQFGAGARFQSQSEIGTMFIAKDGALWFTVLEPWDAATLESIQKGEMEPPLRGGVNLRLSFVGANPHPQIEPFLPLTTSVNYLQGNDPAKWHTHVPVWGGVRYRELYPGIDLELTSVAHQPLRRFVVTDPQRAELAAIVLQIDGAEIRMTEEGHPLFQTSFGPMPLPMFEVQSVEPLALPAPHLTESGVQTPFQAPSDSIGLAPSPTTTLLPSNLHYSTLLGGADYDFAYAVAVDSDGSIYTGGLTESFDFPTTPGAFDPDVGTPLRVRDAYLTKFNPAGTMLDYSTYLQGDNTNQVNGIVVDDHGAAYVTGYTFSTDFPTTPTSPQPTFGGNVDGFLLKLSSDGSALEYGTYLGGNDVEIAWDLALGADGTVTVVGRTNSRNFPTTPDAYDRELGGTGNRFDIFVSKVVADGSAFVYSTYLGGEHTEDGWGVAVDDTGAAYIAGITGLGGTYPTTPGVFDPTPDFAAFVVTKLAPDGSDLIYSTGVGTQAENSASGDIILNMKNEVYVVGTVEISGFPTTAGAYDTECGSAGVGCGSPQNQGDGVLFQLNADGSEMIFGTFVGGNGLDSPYDLQLDADGNVYVIGIMNSTDVIPSSGAYRSSVTGCGLWKFNPTGSDLLHFATPPNQGCHAMALPASDVAVFAGYFFSSSTYETTPSAYDTTPNGESDAVAGRLLITLAATTATIPTTGGALLSHPDTTTYTFAPNPFTETVTLTHAPRHPLSLPPVAPLVTVGSPFVNYAIGTDGESALQPTQPYTLDIYYDPSPQEAGVRLYYWDGTTWIPESSAIVDPTTYHIHATPSRLGWWAVLRQPQQIYLPSIRH